jgi:hypothetical protein
VGALDEIAAALAAALRVDRRGRYPAQLGDLLDLSLEEAVLGEQPTSGGL